MEEKRILGHLCEQEGKCVCDQRTDVLRATYMAALLNAEMKGLPPVYSAEATINAFISILHDKFGRDEALELVRDGIRHLNELLEPDGRFILSLERSERERSGAKLN